MALEAVGSSPTIHPVIKYAEVAELADALDSGSSGRKAMGVQVPSSALFMRT